ncbi:MAG: phenylalanine 4-monooxygenase, partial [Gammaproteobacteria bacterium]|nr:phenylalanine 4-monooxygenase [Gammaproteobacteria bacterium]
MPISSKYIARKPDNRGTIHYSDEENRIWSDLLANQVPGVNKFAASEYLDGLAKLELPRHRIPQCNEISARLGDYTGWKVEPVPALIGFGQFFEMLANRSFPAASFIR